MKRPYLGNSALHNRYSMEKAPYLNTHTLFLAKVVSVHPETGTVDVALDASHQGGFYTDVPVVSWSYGTQTGETYLPNVDLTAPIPSSEGTYDQPIGSGGEDVWAVCGHLAGRANRAVCLGFMSPIQAQIHTKTPGMAVNLHESGVYQVITADGNLNIGLPDGSSIIIGIATELHDMQSENPSWSPKTTSTPYNITIKVKGNVNLTASSIVLNNGTEGVARVGDAVLVEVGGTNYTGTITSGSSTVFSG